MGINTPGVKIRHGAVSTENGRNEPGMSRQLVVA